MNTSTHENDSYIIIEYCRKYIYILRIKFITNTLLARKLVTCCTLLTNNFCFIFLLAVTSNILFFPKRNPLETNESKFRKYNTFHLVAKKNERFCLISKRMTTIFGQPALESYKILVKIKNQSIVLCVYIDSALVSFHKVTIFASHIFDNLNPIRFPLSFRLSKIHIS